MNRLVIARITSARTGWSLARRRSATSTVAPRCSSKEDDSKNSSGGRGDEPPTDWDKAWASYKRKGKKKPLSKFSPNKYVSWNPGRSEYPLSEEIDPIRRSERSNLSAWTSPTFTLGGAIVIVTLLIIYTLSAPLK